MDLALLNKAFEDFTKASKSLEDYYKHLSQRIVYLTKELESKNRQLNKALSEVERNRDLLREVLYNLEEAVVVVDKNEKIVMMNPSAERLFGVKAKDTEGTRLSDLEFSIEYRATDAILSVNGKRYHIIISKSSLTSGGLFQGEVILIKDITKQKELEMQYERNQRLISMGEMAIKIVHEIRNPLCSIELFASMLEREVQEGRLKELARGISNGIKNLDNILTNMLLFARNHKLIKYPFSLKKIVKSVINMLYPIMESKALTLTESVEDYEIIGDIELLKQSLMNILINAIQAEPEGGNVSIYSGYEDEHIVLYIKDNGPGIEKENIERIFDPFFSTKDRGTGLGLTIAAKIMQAHGGFIKVKSEPGKGSEFSLWFPREG